MTTGNLLYDSLIERLNQLYQTYAGCNHDNCFYFLSQLQPGDPETAQSLKNDIEDFKALCDQFGFNIPI